MEITIKNMVCPRCIHSVEQIFEKRQAATKSVELGKVTIEGSLSSQQKEAIQDDLLASGFEWIDNHKHSLIEQIKSLVINTIHHDQQIITNWSTYLAESLHHDYRYISHLFSEVHGITLEQYILRQKAEKIKELICYDQLTLSQIAYQLQYSSVAHLSSQFKKVTGMTPTDFKKSNQNRKSIDLI